jgi:hypothetical protein
MGTPEITNAVIFYSCAGIAIVGFIVFVIWIIRN